MPPPAELVARCHDEPDVIWKALDVNDNGKCSLAEAHTHTHTHTRTHSTTYTQPHKASTRKSSWNLPETFSEFKFTTSSRLRGGRRSSTRCSTASRPPCALTRGRRAEKAGAMATPGYVKIYYHIHHQPSTSCMHIAHHVTLSNTQNAKKTKT